VKWLPRRLRAYTLWGMCSRATCPTCQRPTFAGCGAHVEQVLGDVPAAERCGCGTGASPARGRGGWLGRLTGGR
jgi:hypothetical protein